MLSKISHIMAATGDRVERRGGLLETHKHIAQSCRLLIALISLLVQRLYQLYQSGSCNKPSLVKVCGKPVQISDALCTLSSKTASM